jgi:hypothetical protein
MTIAAQRPIRHPDCPHASLYSTNVAIRVSAVSCRLNLSPARRLVLKRELA